MPIIPWNSRAPQRDGGLDAVRGIAALVVVFYHTSLGFLPHRMTWFIGGTADQGPAVWTRFWFGLMNGPAAVTLFFVLSGYVLTHRCFVTDRYDPLLRTALKRYPRLAGPVLAVCLLAWLLFRLGLHDNAQAALLTGSTWLSTFGADAGPKLAAALRQGLWRTLLFGDVSYNTSLWTMRLELIGSFVSLAGALVLLFVMPWSRVLALGLGLGAAVWWQDSPLFLGQFLAGMTLGVATACWRPQHLPLAIGIVLCAVGLYGFGYTEPDGDYAWLAGMPAAWANQRSVDTACSVLVILVVECCPKLRAGLSVRPLRWLGEISFALYLVHFLVIISAASFVRAWLDHWGSGPATAAAFASALLVSLAAAAPLAWLDRWLMCRLDVVAERLLPRTVAWRVPGPSLPAASSR